MKGRERNTKRLYFILNYPLVTVSFIHLYLSYLLCSFLKSARYFPFSHLSWGSMRPGREWPIWNWTPAHAYKLSKSDCFESTRQSYIALVSCFFFRVGSHLLHGLRHVKQLFWIQQFFCQNYLTFVLLWSHVMIMG